MLHWRKLDYNDRSQITDFLSSLTASYFVNFRALRASAGSLDAKARLVNARAPSSPVLSPRRSYDAQGASGMVVAPGHQRW